MTATMKIDQAGLPAGVAGKSRTDGLLTGALVTLTNTSGASTSWKLLWVPLGDTTAVASLTPTGASTATFSPTAGKFGSYLVEMTENAGSPAERVERRVLVMRTPVAKLIVPALNEIADPTATIATPVTSPQSENADNNAIDFVTAGMNLLPFAGWWRAFHELVAKVEAGGGGGGSPGGADRDIQFNDAGSFGGSSNLQFIESPTEAHVEVRAPSGVGDHDSYYLLRDKAGNPIGEVRWDESDGLVGLAAFGVPLKLGSSAGNLVIESGPASWEWPVADGAVGEVLTTDGAGRLSFQPGGGGGGITTLAESTDEVIDITNPTGPTATLTTPNIHFDSGNDALRIGSGIGASGAGVSTTILGAEVMNGGVTNATYSVLVGHSVLGSWAGGNIDADVIIGHNACSTAGAAQNVTSSVIIGESACIDMGADIDASVYVGKSAGPQSGGALVGANNTAVGYRAGAGMNANSAADNVFVGNAVAEQLSNPLKDVAIGVGAMGTGSGTGPVESVAVGYRAMTAATGGGKNVVVGGEALEVLGAASNITAVGWGAGPAFTGGTDCVLVGTDAAFPVLTGAGNFIGITTGPSGEDITSASGVLIANNSLLDRMPSISQSIGIFTDCAVGAPLIESVVISSQLLAPSGQSFSGTVAIGRRLGDVFAGTWGDSVLLGNILAPTLNTNLGGSYMVLIGNDADVPVAGKSGFISIMRGILADTEDAGEGGNGWARGEARKFATGHKALENIEAQVAQASFRQNNTGLAADLKPVVQMTSVGASNGATFATFTGDRDPNGVVAGTPGDMYVRTGGLNSRVYQHRGNLPGPSGWTELAASGGALTGAGVETLNILACTGSPAMTNNITNGRMYGMAIAPTVSMVLTDLTFHISQNNAGGTLGVGIYDQLGNRLAYSTLAAVALGYNTQVLNNGGPVNLNGGELYYVAMESNINGCAPMGLTDTYNPPVGASVRPLAFFVPNSRSVDATGFPANVAGYFGQVGPEARKYWMLGN